MLRRVLVCAAAALVASAVSSPVTAQAYPYCDDGYNCDYVWFADAGHTQPVGWLLIQCDGSSSSEGIHTRYLEYHMSRCNGS
jgi:hypothetical protein